MTIFNWYRTGTASIANGMPAVSGTLTAWINQVQPGDGISFDGGGTWYEVQSVTDNTNLTLVTNYAGTTVANGAYAIDRRSRAWGDTTSAYAYVVSILNSAIKLFKTTGQPSNTIGSDGALAFDGAAQKIYINTLGTWDGGTSLQGSAATVAVGTTTTGSVGSNASVTNAGTSSAAVLNFTIPQGQTGPTGPANNLSIGTVSTLSPGASATSTITGSAPSQTLNLGIPTGLPGQGAGFNFIFDTSTTMGLPASGALRLNNATFASATAIAVNVNTADSGNPSIAASLAGWDSSSTTAHRGRLLIKKTSAPQNFVEFDITGASTNNTTWYQLSVTYLSGNGTFSASDALSVEWRRTGDAGSGSLNSMTVNGVAYATGLSAATSTAALTNGQLVVGQTGNPPLPKTISGDVAFAATGTATVSNQIRFDSAQSLTSAQQAQARANMALGGTGALCLRNKIRNGNFGVNQRVVSGTVTLAAGQYGHDGAKGGASGCTYTFATSGIDTVLTISAGSLILPIQSILIEGGVYTLSQSGSAQARIWQGTGSTGSGSYAACPQTTGSLTAATQTNVEFSTGTVSTVQFELGSTASAFERRTLTFERILCQTYFRKSYGQLIAPGTNVGNGAGACYSFGNGGSYIGVAISWSPPMATTPSFLSYDNAGNSGKISYVAGGGWVNNTAFNNLNSLNDSGFTSIVGPISGITNFSFDWTASSEI